MFCNLMEVDSESGTVWQVMKATGASVYFNCEDVSYSGRDNQATIQQLKDTVVESADESSFMYSTSTHPIYMAKFICQNVIYK